MAKRNRYRALEKLMTEILLGDALVFILFLIFSSKGLNVLRVITATLSILASVLSVGWLFITGELLRRRSFWMVTGFSSIFLCLIISLILKYPCPPVA
ncbi:hypothetical protein KQI10_02080 [Pseudoflavonifractor sp. MSJ-30]|uniref:hypothetical protein n=1 Tax=Pseudoflavonifractor sp. MSJ-30 TaxID=2841525 RepID=UPI001C11BFE7|nr:hypothetical protein [Pseudoflavonifractor sp. MSJ-30]MBU5451963.1 hypothetical protein [Pseudoflavonifractor sp. MSJ-30]